MFRFISRLVVVAAVVLALMVVTVPVAQARPLMDRTSDVRMDSSWFQAALSWLLGFVPTGGHAPMERATAASDTTGTTGGTGGAHPMTGSCIDPQGGGRFCPEI